MKRPRQVFLIGLVLALVLPFAANAQNFKSSTDGFFIVQTAARADEYYLTEVFKILEKAKTDLMRDWGIGLEPNVLIRIHPNLASYRNETSMPWYIAATADKKNNKIDLQRLKVLSQKLGLKEILRHELFHLAQADDWPRWRAEGSAMIFAKQEISATPFKEISEEELNDILSNPQSRKQLLSANATALLWTRALLRSVADVKSGSIAPYPNTKTP